MNREEACESYQKESTEILKMGLENLEKEYKVQEEWLGKELIDFVQELSNERSLTANVSSRLYSIFPNAFSNR